jgi:DNA primase
LLSRKIDLKKYQFYFSLEQRFINRIIIPFYRNQKLIFWQARSIIKNDKNRFDNAPVSREAVLFNFDQLKSYTTTPLFITEGVFDAMMLDGVALLSSTLNPAKEKLLSESKRRLVFVIDKDKNGGELAKRVLDRGWEIVFSPDGTDDVNHSVQRFGLSWTIYEMMRSIRGNDAAAKLAIELNCRKKSWNQ